jgi:hypothetical protein
MNLLVVMAAMLCVVSCYRNQSPDMDVTPGPAPEPAQPANTRYVVITPINDADKCVVLPYERRMGEEGIEHVTFVNLTKFTVTIAFDDAGAIGDTNMHEIQPEQAETFKLKSPNLEQSYEYFVTADCYEGPPAGPKIIIP